MAQPYSTSAQVRNQAIDRFITEAHWSTSNPDDVQTRIGEGDRMIDAALGALGYVLPFASNPPILQDFSIAYARYACLRDLYRHLGPSKVNQEVFKEYKDQFNDYLIDLDEGLIQLVDGNGNVLERTKYGVLSSATGVSRFFTMDEPESLSQVTPDGYTSPSVTGDPEGVVDGGNGPNDSDGDGDGD